jgi:hypothetical protein
MLALHAIYYLDWTFEIDGVQAPMLRADVLPVASRFQPPSRRGVQFQAVFDRKFVECGKAGDAPKGLVLSP